MNASTYSYPTSRAVQNGDDAIEEERRCLYVAMTRAKDTLTIYRSVESIHEAHGGNEYYFLNDIPKELVNRIVPHDYADYDEGTDYEGDPYSDLLGSSFNFN